MRFLPFVLLCCFCFPLDAQQTESDVIYGYKFGTALVMDVVSPTSANGAGVLFLMSGGMTSDPQSMRPVLKDSPHTKALLGQGYVVFAVYHPSQPKYTVPEIEECLSRAVRFIRHGARRFKVEPERLGIIGFSSGGHLALFAGMAGKPGLRDAADPVDRESSRLRAVVAYYPSSDLSNFGGEGVRVVDSPLARSGRAPFDFHEWNQERKRFERVEDDARYRGMLREISAAAHVTPDDPPTLLIHGDADSVVPVQQSRLMFSLLEKATVPARLEIKTGKDHGWPPDAAELEMVTDWFDRYLAKQP